MIDGFFGFCCTPFLRDLRDATGSASPPTHPGYWPALPAAPPFRELRRLPPPILQKKKKPNGKSVLYQGMKGFSDPYGESGGRGPPAKPAVGGLCLTRLPGSFSCSVPSSSCLFNLADKKSIKKYPPRRPVASKDQRDAPQKKGISQPGAEDIWILWNVASQAERGWQPSAENHFLFFPMRAGIQKSVPRLAADGAGKDPGDDGSPGR